MSDAAHHTSDHKDHSRHTVTTADGLCLAYRRFTPPHPSAVVIVIHGYGEHAGRYEHVCRALGDVGYAAYAMDLRGHGLSGGPRTFITRYSDLLDDVALVRRTAESEHGGLPLVLVGHSMGGTIALGHAIAYSEGLAGIALSAPGVKMGDSVAPYQVTALRMVSRIAPRLRMTKLDYALMTRSPHAAEALLSDPLVDRKGVRAGMGAAHLDAMNEFLSNAHRVRTPMLIMHGTGDRIADIGGSRELASRAVGTDVTTRYYDGLWHNIFDEPERHAVIADLASWIASLR